MAVRYDKKFNAEINRVVASYNRKITRLAKSRGNYDLPKRFTKVSVQHLKTTAVSRNEVRRRLKDLQSFTAKGGERTITIGGASMPKYQYENIKRYQRLLRVQTTRKLKKYETTHPISNGKEEPLTFAQYGTAEYLTLKTKKMDLLDDVDLSKMSKLELDIYLHKLKVNTREYDLDLWKKNYINILEDTALSYGYDTDKLEYIVDRIKTLTPEQFDDLSFVNKNIKEVLTKYKALLDINTAKELRDNASDVFSNLDSLYDDIDDIIAEYV